MNKLFNHHRHNHRSESERCHSENRDHGTFCHGRGEQHRGHHHHRRDLEGGHPRRCAHGHGEEDRRSGHGRQRKLHRMFEHGDLRVVLLALIDKKPGHGYELIKSIEEATSGLYTPSPGVIYPTLTLLEEQDFVESNLGDKGRKSYQITAEGKDYLGENQHIVDAIFQRLNGVNEERGKNLAEEIQQAMHRLRGLLRYNMVRGELSEQQIQHIAAALNSAVDTIEAELKLDSESKNK